jgi:DNA-binding transcriptional regulator LsrR (DeoR family)
MNRSCGCMTCYKKNVTNRRLANLIGISEQQVGKYVNKCEDPSLYRLHQIANAL